MGEFVRFLVRITDVKEGGLPDLEWGRPTENGIDFALLYVLSET